MTYPTDIEIAQQCEMKPITEIAKTAGIDEKYIEQYGRYKAKIDLSIMDAPNGKDGKLILVTAMTPTPAGEGKTTTTIGLADGLKRIGKNVTVALREPSLGPVFGVKGGAAGGGYAQVVPMEDINLHFTGDFHAIGAANNLLAAMIDNHIHQGNALGIDPRRITWKRCVDMNDRQLRFVVDGLGGKANGVPREDGYDITVASEIMAVLCLSSSISDLKQRLSRIIVGYTYGDEPVTCGQLKAAGAMAALLKDALKPNLVQTLEGTPAFVHGGPFANIAHGCNSVTATRLSLRMSDYTVTEAGFGADLGAEKFLDIKCRMAGLTPSAVVVVATIRALKMHGGLPKTQLATEDLDALKKGLPNLLRHVSNIKNVYKLPCVVAVNRFPTDTDAEIDEVIRECRALGVNTVLSTVWADGGKGGEDLAREVVRLCEEEKGDFTFSYEIDLPIEKKIEAVVKKVYGGDGVEFSTAAKKQIKRLEELGFGNLPVCIAKTQYSFSDNPTLLGAPTGFSVAVKNVKVSAGAGFIVVLTGDIMTMPGLPKSPAAERIDVDENGRITGLF
ncbi:MAG: formate--tetrahydrofolate ligase [Eubacteriales bacterium]|nr:formate--tetrahydrofolate ligase [Clostridiales bacterium]MDD6341541.1 formate--tetrahydrofolate ligase [Eubacteriales bacterium]MDY3760593.1 formate--tetrahydrofolate ligase [Eubacteriales bacterium]